MKEGSAMHRLLWHKIGMIIVGIQLIILALLSVSIGRLHILSTPIFIGLLIIEIIYWTLMFSSQLVHNKLHYIMKVVTVFGIIISGILLFIVNRGSSTMNKITGNNQETKVINIVALKENKANVLEDLEDINIGIVKDKNADLINAMLSFMKDTIKKEIKTQEFQDYPTMVESLYDHKIEAIAVDNAFVPVIEELHSTYQADTKILYTYEYTTKVELEKESSVNKENEEKKEITERSFNVFLSGIDTSGSIDEVSRSDVNMIVTVNPVTKQILLSSTPRDYYVTTPVSGDMRDKLTHAGIYGIKTSVATLEALYDIHIGYYAKVNFSGFEKMIDALGGIKVNSKSEFTSRNCHFNIGENECDGEKALAFVRDRYSFTTGDLMRNQNQQAVVKGIIDKITTPSILLNINPILDAATDCVITNMPQSDLMKLVNMQLEDRAKWTITTVGVSGTDGHEITFSNQKQKSYVMYPDNKQVEKAANKMQEVYHAK